MIQLAYEMPGWADDPAPGAKFDRNAFELPRYAAIERELTRETQSIVSELQGQRISRDQAVSRFEHALYRAEADAFVAGRRARGDLRQDLNHGERRMLEGRHARNVGYFRNFAADVQAGRGRMDYMRRAGMYGQSLWSLYTRGETSDWEDPADYNARYHWILDPDADHCSSTNPNQPGCVQRAQRSIELDGYSWEELSELGWPGERTPCLTRCRCHVRVVRKRLVLPERLEGIGPAESPEEGLRIFEQLLGGAGMPLALPAAGVPFVKVEPAAIVKSLESAGKSADSLAMRLPEVPSVLARPDAVAEAGDTRIHTRDGLAAAIARTLGGWWRLVAVLLSGDAIEEGGRAA